MFLHSLRGIVVVMLCVVIQSCGTPEYLSEPALSRYVLDEDHGLSKKVVSGDFEIRVTYRPTDLLVAQELGSSTNAAVEEVIRLREKYGSYNYFVLSLSHSGKEILNPSGGQSRFSDLLQFISFRMGEVISLTANPGRDTIALADFMYNRTFGLSKSTDVLLVFDRSKIIDSQEVSIHLNEFGLGIGKQSLSFNVSDLDSTPHIYNIEDSNH